MVHEQVAGERAALKIVIARLGELGLDNDAIGRRLVEAGLDHIAEHAHCAYCLSEQYISLIESMQRRCLDACVERYRVVSGRGH